MWTLMPFTLTSRAVKPLLIWLTSPLIVPLVPMWMNSSTQQSNGWTSLSSLSIPSGIWAFGKLQISAFLLLFLKDRGVIHSLLVPFCLFCPQEEKKKKDSAKCFISRVLEKSVNSWDCVWFFLQCTSLTGFVGLVSFWDILPLNWAS